MLLSASLYVLQHHAASAPTRRFRYLHSYTFSCQFSAAKNDDVFRDCAQGYLQCHVCLEDMYFAKSISISAHFLHQCLKNLCISKSLKSYRFKSLLKKLKKLLKQRLVTIMPSIFWKQQALPKGIAKEGTSRAHTPKSI